MRKLTGAQPKLTLRSRLLPFGCMTIIFLSVLYFIGGILLFLFLVMSGNQNDTDSGFIPHLFINLYAFPVLFFLLMTFGIGMLWSTRNMWLLRFRGINTTGTITKVYWDDDIHKATIRFKARNGTKYDTNVVLNSNIDRYLEGQAFPVRYDIHDPTRAGSIEKRTTVIGKIGEGVGSFLGLLIIYFFGLGWLGLGLALLYGFLAQWIPGLPH